MLMKRRNKIATGVLATVALLTSIWLTVNSSDQFGLCCYALTTYNRIPILIGDIEIRSDGTNRNISKTHDLSMDKLDWLLESPGEVLIISTGWDGFVKVDPQAKNIAGPEVHILKNAEAILLFNQCKREGRRVSIHYHSTC